jgi:hypothetical protein
MYRSMLPKLFDTSAGVRPNTSSTFVSAKIKKHADYMNNPVRSRGIRGRHIE